MGKRNVFDSPNPTIEKAIEMMLGKLKTETMPPEIAVKILQTAIAWEKAKQVIRSGGRDTGYDPDEDDEEED
jgi:hypothetical protein